MKVVFAAIIALAGCATDPSTKAGEDNTGLDTSIDSSDTSGIRGDSGAMGDSGDALTPSHCERGTNPGTISNLTCIKQAACTWAGDRTNCVFSQSGTWAGDRAMVRSNVAVLP